MGRKSRHLWAYFRQKPIRLKSRYDRWRQVAKEQKISRSALGRLEWIIFYETKSTFNVLFTCRHFGISSKTFYKYLKRFDSADFTTLEEKSRAPIHVRQKQITSQQEQRIITLRRLYMNYGKEKLREEYKELYGADISAHKIYYTIAKHHLYKNPAKVERAHNRSGYYLAKKRITTLKRKNRMMLGHLIQVDTIVLHLFGLKRYIITAIDLFGKVAYARCYKNQSSFSAADFLQRLNYLLDDKIVNVQTDNGSEFAKYFERACNSLGIDHYFSRVRTPKDNAVLERFNRTLQEEWLDEGNFAENIDEMNRRLTEWLVFYNFKRRHYSLDNISPINYLIKYRQVLPMSPTSTRD